MKKSIIVCLVVLLISCNQKTKDLSGTYKTSRYNIIELLWLQITNSGYRVSYAVGNTIKLNEDSTFMYKTCGAIQKGTWNASKDTLLLNVETSDWRIDSLREFGFNGKKHPIIPEKPIRYLINGNKIIQEYKIRKKRKDKLVFFRLKKV